jgi:hypothetical protein
VSKEETRIWSNQIYTADKEPISSLGTGSRESQTLLLLLLVVVVAAVAVMATTTMTTRKTFYYGKCNYK